MHSLPCQHTFDDNFYSLRNLHYLALCTTATIIFHVHLKIALHGNKNTSERKESFKIKLFPLCLFLEATHYAL